MNDCFLNVRDFTFEPYNPVVGGDSGALFLAASKQAPDARYVVKSATPELACNEYMHHRIAAALGLHSQEVRLFRRSRRFKFAAGIRYAEDARMMDYEKDVAADPARFADFIAFQMLYVILNEEDSQEYHIVGDGRLFKLDNAASFNLGGGAVALSGRLPQEEAIDHLKRSLNLTEYGKYRIQLGLLTERFGEPGRAASLSLLERFAALDESALEDAVDAVSEVYSVVLGEYFHAFIASRKELCARFLNEVRGET